MTALTNKNVLIVESDEKIRSELCAYISKERSHWYVFEAENAFQGLEIADKESIDFFIIDHFLPGLLGLNLIIELKRVHMIGKFSLLLVAPTEHLQAEIKAMNVISFMKPITIKEMASIVSIFDS